MTNFALLAPVPQEHLESGLKTLEEFGEVAFGSRAWEFFRELDAKRDGKPVDAYIYASHSDKFGAPKVRWLGRYIGFVLAEDAARLDQLKYRPSSTLEAAGDKVGHWALYWKLDQLELIDSDKAIEMNRFIGMNSKKAYVKSFMPEGPLMIEAP
jgi:hypothetical protein